MKFIKSNAKYIIVIMMCIFGSVLATMATNYAFESSDVKFDNTGTSLESVNVQDAIDETFHHVTDYNEIKTTIGNSTLTTTNQTLTGGINELNDKVTTIYMLSDTFTFTDGVATLNFPQNVYVLGATSAGSHIPVEVTRVGGQTGYELWRRDNATGALGVNVFYTKVVKTS